MEFFGNIIKGIMIGIANIIPGVSGGTMAVSLGIYDRLIGSISGLFREFKKSILFLIPIIIGAGIGIVGFTYAIEYLLDKHTFVTCMAFVGLILGGLPAIFSSMRAKVSSGGVGVFGILAFVIAFAISGGMPLLKESKDALTVIAVTPGNMVILFILGIVASATMVIPGVSGSMMLMIFVMILLFGVELLGYRLWLRKAKRNARELGIFTPTHSSRWLSFLRSIWIFVFWALMVIPLLFRSAGLCIVLVSAGVVLVPVGGAVLVGKQVRKRSVPPKKRRLILVLTVLCSVLLSVMLMIGVMTYGISSGWFDDVPKNAEEYTYTVGGSPQVGYLYHDTLPLYVQGLTDTDYARYSCEALERGDSVFVRQVEYRQELPYDVRWSDENDPPLPELFYTVIDVKLAPLFNFCLQSTLRAEDLYGIEYRETDPAPWGADRAWRECDAHSGEKYDTWLLIYGQRIVEFHPRSFSPDAAQMAVIGETLGK